MNQKKYQFTRHHYLKQKLDLFARQEPQIPVHVLDAIKEYCTKHEIDPKNLSTRQIVRILALIDNRRLAVHALSIRRRLCLESREQRNDWTMQSVTLRVLDENACDLRLCCICLGALHEIDCENDQNKHQPIKTLLCRHAFHRECIDQWLALSQTCPYCRQAQMLRTTALGCDLQSFVSDYVGRPLLTLLHGLLKSIANAWAALVRDTGEQIVFPSDYCMAQIAMVLCESALLSDENTRHLAQFAKQFDFFGESSELSRQHEAWLAIIERWRAAVAADKEPEK